MPKDCVHILTNSKGEQKRFANSTEFIKYLSDGGFKEIKETQVIQQPQDEGTASGNELVASKESIPATTEVNKNSEQASEIKVGELIDKPITYNGKKATLYQDGQTVVAKIEGEPKEFELGNIDEIKDKPISDFNIQHETSVVSFDDNGDIKVRDESYKNNYSDPLAAINHDENGNVVSVNLETADGKKRTFRGNIAEDIAYQIHLKEINKNNEIKNEFEQFINSDEPTSKEINDAGLSEVTETKPTENNAKVQRTKAQPKTVEPIPVPEIKENTIEVKLPDAIEPVTVNNSGTESQKTEPIVEDNPPPEPPVSDIQDSGTGDKNTVGVSHAALTDLAQRLGLKEPERGTYINPETYADRGRKLLEAGADPEEINNPNNTLHDRIAIGRAHLEDLVKTADEAIKSGGVESPEFEAAQKALNEYASKVKALGTDAHRAMVSLQGERDLDTNSFTAVRKSVEDLTGKAPSKEQDAKIKDLTEQNQSLKTKAEEAEAKLIQETDKAFKAGVEEGKKKSNTDKAKNIANKFRKLKTKPFVFKDENGNTIDIQKMGIDWNDLVELGAKAIEKTGEIADGIAEILDKVKDAEWYKALSEKDRISLEKQLTAHYEDAISETPEAKKVKALQKQLENIQRGIVKQKGITIEDTPAIKDLKDEIFDAKKNLGLIKSKPVTEVKVKEKITEEQKRINRLEKELEDLQQGVVKQHADKFEDTPKIKDLKDKIFEAKKDLGLISSKVKTVKETDYGMKETPEVKNIKRLEKQLEDLQNGIAKQSDAVKRKLSDREKELQDQIFEAKKNLGLVPSKDLPKAKINKTSEQIKLDKLQKELEDLQQGIVKQKAEKPEDTQAVKDLKEKILEEKEKLGLRPSKMEKPEDEISPEQKNINRLQKELDRLQTEGKLKSKTDSREITDEEKILQDQIKSEQNKIKLKKLQQDFLNKKDNKFSTDEAKSIWDYAKSEYLDNGVSFRDMIGQVANDLGLSWRQITEAVTTPKTKRISDEMWKRQGEYRRNQNATKNWIADQNKSKAIKALKFIPDKLRGLAVFGHGGIFVGTHSGMNLFMPSTWNKVLPAFIRGWKYAYGNEANYQRDIEELKNKPNYGIAQRAGLKNNPERVNVEEFQKSQSAFGKLGLAGEKGFNAIKVLRQDLFDYHYNKLSQAEKADPESAKSIARLINNATGATNLNIPEWINEVTFAGGMEAARWGKLTRNPVEATNTAIRAILKPESASVGDRVFAKVWARRVGEQLATYGALLALNAALQSKIDPKNKTNITDPTKGAWLKFKFGDKTLDLTSGMISVATFISSLINDSIKNKKERRGDSVLQSDAKNTFGYLRGKLSPGYGTALDLKTGTDFAGNTLPYNSDKPQAGKRQLSWLEYAEQKLPLPVAEAFTIMRQSAQDNGMEKPQLENIMDGIMAGGVSFATGFRMGETKEKPTPYTEADNQDPVFKYFLDKGMALPNTSLQSEKIKDEATLTVKKISEYPKEIQDTYQQTHKDKLKEELSNIEDEGTVYVNKYGEISLNNSGGLEEINLDKLNTKQLSEVLHLAQAEATKKAKKEVFGGQ